MTGLIERDDLVIFVLNSGFLCSSKQEIIHGKISTTQLEWLESELQKQTSINKWKIIILHHHPFAYEYPIVYPEYSTLEEGPQLQRLCGQYGVNLVVHGHYHFPIAKTRRESGWNNPVTFISSGSLSVNQEGRLNGSIPNTFHYIQLEEYPNLIKLITYEYSLGSGWRKVTHGNAKAVCEETILEIRERMKAKSYEEGVEKGKRDAEIEEGKRRKEKRNLACAKAEKEVEDAYKKFDRIGCTIIKVIAVFIASVFIVSSFLQLFCNVNGKVSYTLLVITLVTTVQGAWPFFSDNFWAIKLFRKKLKKKKMAQIDKKKKEYLLLVE